MRPNNLWRQPPRSWKNRLKIGDLAPDGVKIVVPWDKITAGGSFFVPCVNTVELVRQVFDITDKRNWSVVFRPRIEGGKWGVRFWRVL